MMNFSKFNTLLLFFTMVFTIGYNTAEAQVVWKDHKLYLNEDGSNYVKATFLTQAWFRHMNYNPGTTIFGNEKDKGADIGIRRYRVQLYSRITDRIFIYSQFGQNNFNNIADRKAGFFVHDAVAEYAIDKKRFAIGMGLTGWSGLCRFSSPSVGTIMGIDAPLYEQSTNDVTDQFLRKLSIYAKGKLGKLDYRVTMAHPMAIQKSANYTAGISAQSTYSPKPPKMQWNGYFQYQFLDQESNETPYTTGTYLGKKKVLNIGAGFQCQPDAMWHTTESGDTTYSPMVLLSGDVYYDAPVGQKGAAVSVYGNVAYYNLGTNYLRSAGAMNPANGNNNPAILNGAGNAYPNVGTGMIYYVQAGYKLKDDLIGKTTFLPYVSWQYADFERLKHSMSFVDAGVSWLLPSHISKLSIAYQNRPIYQTDGTQIDRKGGFVVQYQVYFN